MGPQKAVNARAAKLRSVYTSTKKQIIQVCINKNNDSPYELKIQIYKTYYNSSHLVSTDEHVELQFYFLS